VAVPEKPASPGTEPTASTTQPTDPRVSFGSWAFAFGPYSQAPWSFERVCAFVADAGYDGVEINGFRPHPHPHDFNTDYKRSELGKKIAGFGLGISGFAPDMTAVPPALSTTSSYLREIDATRAFCEQLGITSLRVDSILPPEELDRRTYEQRFTRMTRSLAAAAGRLESSGIQLVWEFEPGFWLNKPSEVVRLIESVSHPNFGVLFDTSHALTSARGRRHAGEPEFLAGGAIEYAQLLAPHVRHLHLIDSVGDLHDDDTSEHLPFGAGEIDFDLVLDALGDSARRLEWWTVDFCFWPNVDRDGAAAVPFVKDLLARRSAVS
jgi:sugar phosphate isomerase/epimerase